MGVKFQQLIFTAQRQAPAPDLPTFARQNLHFEPDPRQEALLLSTAPRLILNCTRQWGKSTVTAIKALYFAHTHPEGLVIVASPSLRQSAEFLRKVKSFAARLCLRSRGAGRQVCGLLLPNGARIVGLPGREDTVRGFSSVGLLVIDEAACVPDAMYHALKPMLAASNGELWLMSTPHGQRGFFHKEWTRGEGWQRLTVPASQCPRLSSAYLEWERKSMPENLFRQEYECEFTETEGQWMARHIAEGLLCDDVEPLWR
jgi:hypothetical protein